MLHNTKYLQITKTEIKLNIQVIPPTTQILKSSNMQIREIWDSAKYRMIWYDNYVVIINVDMHLLNMLK